MTDEIKQALFNHLSEQSLPYLQQLREPLDVVLRETEQYTPACFICKNTIYTAQYWYLSVKYNTVWFKPFFGGLSVCYNRESCEQAYLIKKFQESVHT